jgi:hypothetical protein
MAFEFRILVDRISNLVFPGDRLLIWMDKIASHVIQMDSNPDP